MAKDTRLYIKAVGKIQELIASGTYGVGSRLPPERQLAEQFGVSRPTIREALIALEAKGLVSVKTGSGVYVIEQKPNRPGFVSLVSAFELIEARVIIEGEVAARAAEMITKEELAALKESIDQMAVDPASSTEADRKFHSVLSDATKNRALSSLVRELWEIQESLENIRQAHEAVCNKDSQRRIEEHTAIYEALRARDSRAARLAMRRHFSRMLNAMHETSEEHALREARQQASEMRKRFSSERLAVENR